MKTASPLLLAGTVGGLALLAVLVMSVSTETLMIALASGGWPLLAAIGYRVVPLLLNTLGWRTLLPANDWPPLPTLLRLRWIGESINALLPVAQVGGDLARARLLTLTGVRGEVAATSMIADVTIGAAMQVVFTLAGTALVVLRGAADEVTTAISLGLGLLAAGAATLMIVVRLGMTRLVSILPSLLRRNAAWRELTDGAATVDVMLAYLLRRRRLLLKASLWHLAGWLTQVGETWFILTMLGAPVDLGTAFVIESLSAAARAAAFFVPGGLGVQEGALLGLATHMGLGAPETLALGIIKRLREIAVSAPALVAWSIAERHFLGRVARRRWRGRADEQRAG